MKNKTKKTKRQDSVCQRSKVKCFASSLSSGRMLKSGFTLVETLIAVLIFSIVMVLLSGTFASFIKSYAQNRKIQKDTESAQYAMNLMAKTLRTSSLLTITFPLRTFDYSQTGNNCMVYDYVSPSKITFSSTTTADSAACGTALMPAATDLTSNNIVNASVLATATTGTTRGKVTIVLSVQSNGSSAIPIQTTVSLRQ